MKALTVVLVTVVFPLCYFTAQPVMGLKVFRPAKPISFSLGEVSASCVPLEGVELALPEKGRVNVTLAVHPRRAAVALEFAQPVDLSAMALAFDIRASSPAECRVFVSDANRCATHASDAVSFAAGEDWKTVYMSKKDLISAVDARKIQNVILEFSMNSENSGREVAIKQITLLAQQ